MCKPLYILIFSFLLFSFKSEYSSIEKGTLNINLSNIRNADGYIYIFIYQYENQYPYSPYKYYKVAKSKLNNGCLIAKIANLDYNSTYAISLIDDENNNEDLDRWLGIPHEGYGFSNNIKPFLSLPEFEDLTFSFKQNKTMNVKVQYVL